MREFVLVVSMCSAFAPSCRGAQEPSGEEQPPATRDVAETKTTSPATNDAPAKPDPCGAAALGLGQARALAPWTPPAGCTPQGSGAGVVRSDADLAARLQCPEGIAAGVDLAKQTLVSLGYTLSPAGVGVVAFDDGKVVTLVSRQRNPCPDDPLPMPMNATAWFLLPDAGERTFANATCTVDSQCD